MKTLVAATLVASILGGCASVPNSTSTLPNSTSAFCADPYNYFTVPVTTIEIDKLDGELCGELSDAELNALLAPRKTDGKIRLGYTRSMLIAEWGAPERKSVHVSRYGKRELFVYGCQYVHLDDGKVSSWSNYCS